MPIYEYQCQDCGHQLEKLQKISDPALTECPNCNSQGLKKLVSAAGFQLKGSGWYVTDFRDKKKLETTAKQTSDNKTDTKANSSEKKTDKLTKKADK